MKQHYIANVKMNYLGFISEETYSIETSDNLIRQNQALIMLIEDLSVFNSSNKDRLIESLMRLSSTIEEDYGVSVSDFASSLLEDPIPYSDFIINNLDVLIFESNDMTFQLANTTIKLVSEEEYNEINKHLPRDHIRTY